MHSEVDFGEKQ